MAELSAPLAIAPVLTLRAFGVGFGERTIFRDVDITLPAHGLTVLLGPSGTGKSTLLRTVAGHLEGCSGHWVRGDMHYNSGAEQAHPPLAVQRAGLLMVSLRENLVTDWAPRARLTALEQSTHLAAWLDRMGLGELAARLQVPVVELSASQQALVKLLRILLLDAPLVLVDEPTAGLSDDQAAPLLDVLRQQARHRALLVCMHHLRQSRAMADRVLLLASGRIQEDTPAEAFFRAPRSESGRLLLATGSCPETSWWQDTPPPAHQEPVPAQLLCDGGAACTAAPAATLAQGPDGFVWLLDGQLAGTPRPGLLRPLDEDLRELRAAGVTRLLSLTRSACDTQAAARHGIQVRAQPIVDMQPPSLDEAFQACRWIDACLAQGEPVAVHCHAGLGRTGTILACHVLWRSRGALSAGQALAAIRRRQNAWVQSAQQQAFLEDFAQAIARRAVTATA